MSKPYDIKADGFDIDNNTRYTDANKQIWILLYDYYSKDNSTEINIKKGDELTYDYGFAFDKDDFRDHVCKCGTRDCVGFIVTEADWKKLQRFLLKLAKNCTKTN